MKTLRSIGAILSVILPLLAVTASAQTLTNIWLFTGSNDGASPNGLVQGIDGNFYGTTAIGGSSPNCNQGCGTVFRISPSGSFTNLHSFSGNDGASPAARLVQGSDGNFYGTTRAGGASTQCYRGCGTVFRISPSGSFTNLYSFNSSDGANPADGLVQVSDGNFYGATVGGGASTNCGNVGCGTVFRINPNGTFTNLYLFSGGDGASPEARLVQGSDGNLYGTTRDGGTNNYGTVFKINSTGSLTTMHSFSLAEGINPGAGLVQGSDGNFYGSTGQNGTNGGYGMVFKISPISPDFTLTYLHSFHLYGDGGYPSAALLQGSDGSFYGTTVLGGTNILEVFGGTGYGAVFSVSPSSSFTNVYTFHGPDGFMPQAPLVQGSDGNFYGASAYGGYTNLNSGFGFGTLFKIYVPLSPPANQISAVQLSDTNLVFTIPSVAGETYQLQYSSAMNPTNWVNVAGASATNSVGALMTLTNFGGSLLPHGFYRFAITP